MAAYEPCGKVLETELAGKVMTVAMLLHDRERTLSLTDSELQAQVRKLSEFCEVFPKQNFFDLADYKQSYKTTGKSDNR